MPTYTDEQIEKMYPGFFERAHPVGVNALPSSTTPIEPQTPGFGQRVKQDFTERKGKVEEIKQSDFTKGSKVLQNAGQVAGGVGDIIWEGLKSITPDKLEKKIVETATKGIQKVMENPKAQEIKTKIESWAKLHPEAAGNLEALFNIASLVPEGKAVELGAKGAVKAGTKVAATGLDVATMTEKGIARGVSEASGSFTGLNRGGELALRQSLESGGEKATLARKAMRGKITPEETQQVALDAVESIADTRKEKYLEGLDKIGKETFTNRNGQLYVKKFDKELNRELFVPTDITTKGMKDIMTKSLKDLGLDAKGGTIDFSKRPTLDSNNIQKISDYVYNFDDLTPKGLITLSQEIRGFRKGGLNLSPAENRFNYFVDRLSSNIKEYTEKGVPQIGEMNKAYEKSTELINDIQKNLSLGGRAGIDTAFKKFGQILRNDTDARKALLQELDIASGGKLIPMVSGTMANPILPRGLTRLGSGLFAGGAGLEGGGVIPAIKAFIIAAGATSPRLAGEIINILNLPRKALKPVREAIKGFIEKESLIPSKETIQKGVNKVKGISN